jgi:hypothetical protein
MNQVIILSRVYDCMTNNNGFWIGWFYLLTLLSQSLFITIYLQQLTINLQPSTWLPTTRSIRVFVLRLTPYAPPYSSYSSAFLQLPASEFDSLIIPRHWPHGKHFSSVVLECVFIGPLPNNGLFIKNLSPREGVLWVRYLAMDICEPHSIKPFLLHGFYCCVRVIRALSQYTESLWHGHP